MKQQKLINCAESCFSQKHFLFRHLSLEELGLLAENSKGSAHKRGSILYQEGSRISGVYCVNSGIIKIYKTGTDGKEQIIRFARQGDIIGFRSVLARELACSTAEVINEASTCYIPGELLFQLIKNNGNFSLEFIQLTCRELGEANSYITDIAQKTVRERLAEILIHLMEEFGVDEKKVLKISLTREELANIVGTATESVIRLLSEFKQDKYIEIEGRHIALLNIAALKKLANL